MSDERYFVMRNQDRYMRCTSCKATAEFNFVSRTATYTRIGADELRGWDGETPIWGPKIDVKPIVFSACRRHTKINLGRVLKAQSKVTQYDGQRNVEVGPEAVARAQAYSSSTPRETNEQYAFETMEA